MMEGVDGKFYAVTSGGNSASTTNKVTDAELRVGGKILYFNSATDIATNGNATSMYEGFYSGEMEYWSNKPAGWAVAYRPFYIVATKNASGHFELLDKGTASSAFITQTLPSTDDGRYYIQIGYMNNAYDAWRLQTDHPIYQFKNGKLRLYVTDDVIRENDYRLIDSRPPTAHTHDNRYYTEGEVDSKIFLKSDTDNRNINTVPNDYNSKFEIKGLKTNTIIGIADGGVYSALLGLRGWTDSSGGPSHELAFDSSGRINHRQGSTTT